MTADPFTQLVYQLGPARTPKQTVLMLQRAARDLIGGHAPELAAAQLLGRALLEHLQRGTPLAAALGLQRPQGSTRTLPRLLAIAQRDELLTHLVAVVDAPTHTERCEAAARIIRAEASAPRAAAPTLAALRRLPARAPRSGRQLARIVRTSAS